MQSPTQRSLIPHDNLVQALASDGADESFHKTDFARGIAAQWALPPFLYLESCRRSPFRRWRLDRAAHIAAPPPRETLLASAACSTPAWGIPSPRSAPPGVAHAIARRRRIGPGRSPSARRKNQWLWSVQADSVRKFAKSRKAVCGDDANTCLPWIAPRQ